MRYRTLLPLIGLLALAACKDSTPKKTEPTNPPPASTAPAPPPPAAPNTAPVNPTNPAPSTAPAPH